VFTWSDGFHAHPVAVTSRPKALEAWGVDTDLFRSGYAREVTSGPEFEAAMASPGEVLRLGQAVDVGKLEPAPRKRAAPRATAAQKAKVAKLEADLDALDVARQAETAAQDAARAKLEKEIASAADRYDRDRAALFGRLKAARKAARM
ncbi:MAG: hypothetical protein REJ23_07800, partial [Brevundimonas sp.]|nr:hypothetical protein [Brevundimonas sp.]